MIGSCLQPSRISQIRNQQPAEPKGYIVQRSYELYDGGPNGSPTVTRYLKVNEPEPGETIYHGQFRKVAEEHDEGQYSRTTYYYVPLDPKKITTSIYEGNAETF